MLFANGLLLLDQFLDLGRPLDLALLLLGDQHLVLLALFDHLLGKVLLLGFDRLNIGLRATADETHQQQGDNAPMSANGAVLSASVLFGRCDREQSCALGEPKTAKH